MKLRLILLSCVLMVSGAALAQTEASEQSDPVVYRKPATISPPVSPSDYAIKYCLDAPGQCSQELIPRPDQMRDAQIRSGRCSARSKSHPYSSGYSQDNYSVDVSCSPF